jgi:hypothetical protein
MKKPEPYVIERDGKFWAVTEFVGPFAEVTEAWRWVDDNTDGGRQDVVWRDQLRLIFGGRR